MTIKPQPVAKTEKDHMTAKWAGKFESAKAFEVIVEWPNKEQGVFECDSYNKSLVPKEVGDAVGRLLRSGKAGNGCVIRVIADNSIIANVSVRHVLPSESSLGARFSKRKR
jgi:hypothetical protein